MEEVKQGRCGDEAAPTEPPNCPECLSKRIYKDGIRKNNGQRIQRYICRDCGYRFSDPSDNRRPVPYEQGNQSNPDTWASHSGARKVEEYKKSTESETYRLVCANEAKNLAATEITGNVVAGEISETKSLLFQFTWYMKKQAFAESTITTRVRQIDVLIKRGAKIHDPESVKEVIASQSWVNKRKQNVVDTYSCFLTMQNRTWNPPKYKAVQHIPFIPTESELDLLIDESGPKNSAFLLLLKETAVRAGEAQMVKWTDVDFESHTVRITPEKGSYPRIVKVSNKLINKLAALRRRDLTTDPNRIFGKLIRSIRRVYIVKRKKLAYIHDNPRLLQIHFHTFRHWKATSLYHQTKDIVYVQRFLGHRSIMNTMRYIHIEQAYYKDEADQYICKVARTVEEAIPLLEEGFTEASDLNGVKIYRKTKGMVVPKN